MMQLLLSELLDWVNPKNNNLDSYSNNSPMGHSSQIQQGSGIDVLESFSHFYHLIVSTR